jgi:hypothetical protein
MEEAFEAFLAGDRPHHVAAYFDGETLSDPDTLAAESYAAAVDGGVRIVVPGEAGQAAFESATGIDPMDFAGAAMGTEGSIDHSLTAGDCPGEGAAHEVEMAFAFAEEQNETAGGLYAEGDVIHAYVMCACGQVYSDKWVADPD